MPVLQRWFNELGTVSQPWMEPEKWFPLDEYLLKNNGIDLVKDFPGLNRPAVPKSPAEKTLQGLQKLVKNKTPAKRELLFPLLIDSRGGVDVKEEVDREMLLGKNIEMPKLLGFEDLKIVQVLAKRFNERKENFATYYEFMEKLMKEPDVVFKSKLTIKSAKELLHEVKCNKCRQEESCVMFLPCAIAPTSLSVFCAPENHICVRFAVI